MSGTGRRLRDLIDNYADSKNLDKDKTKVIILEVWAELRRKMDSMDETCLKVPGLGSFQFKHWKIDKISRRWENMHNTYPTSITLEELTKLDNIREKIKQEKNKKDNHRVKRTEWIHNKNRNNDNQGKTAKGMGEQEPDS